MTTGESQEQEGGYYRSTKRQTGSPLCIIEATYVTSRTRSWKPKIQKYNGRVVLRGDIVKDDSGASGSSASQMTAETVMDALARLRGCDGQAADAVSACTQVTLEDAPRLLNTF